jgi:hypothetical protein
MDVLNVSNKAITSSIGCNLRDSQCFDCSSIDEGRKIVLGVTDSRAIPRIKRGGTHRGLCRHAAIVE